MRQNLHVALMASGWVMAGALGAAHAQPPSDPIAACRAEATDAARIACLEREVQALRALRDGSTAPLGLSEPVAGPRAPNLTVLAPGPASPNQGAVGVPAIPPVAAPQLGDEQVQQRQERRKPKKERKVEQVRQLDARAIDFAYTAGQRLLLVLENGQVWIQLGGDVAKPILRHGEIYEVTIRRGAISGYRLNIADVTIAVERLK